MINSEVGRYTTLCPKENISPVIQEGTGYNKIAAALQYIRVFINHSKNAFLFINNLLI